MGPLHYLVMSANNEPGYWNHLTIHEFAKRVEEFGCIKAYAMDGGNTGSIVMNGKLINRTTFGYERAQGDLLYFCTAIPNPSEKK
jgi:exopolysaccharide biosynthesis protein